MRINKTKRTFEKGYLPNWTQELFKISAVIKTQSPVTYKMTDLDGESVRGTFYSHELQHVEKDQIYEIESILNHRKRKAGKKWVKEIKVHWKGYPSKFEENNYFFLRFYDRNLVAKIDDVKCIYDGSCSEIDFKIPKGNYHSPSHLIEEIQNIIDRRYGTMLKQTMHLSALHMGKIVVA